MSNKSQIQHLSIFIIGILVTLGVSAKSWADVGSSDGLAQVGQPLKSVTQCSLEPTSLPHGGGEVPSLQVNQHVELAIGEYYSLYGTVIAGSDNQNGTSMNSVPMFAVDLQAHPWLASALRVRSPYYYLPGGWNVWNRYVDKRVLLTAQAQAIWVRRPSGERVFGISLQPVDAGAVTPSSPALNPQKPSN